MEHLCYEKHFRNMYAHIYIYKYIEIIKCVYLGISFSSLKEDVLRNMFNKIWD